MEVIEQIRSRSVMNGAFDSTSTRFHKMWEKAAKLARRGQESSAQQVWLSALKQSVKAGCARSMKVALAGLEQGRGYTALGPATTPSMATPSREYQIMVLETAGGTYTLERRQLEGFVKAAKLDILVDIERENALIGEIVVGMEGREIPLKILASMVRRQGKPMTLGQIFEDAWGRKYNPSFDSNTVYFHMCRLRKILEDASAGLKDIVIKVTGGYRLQPGLRMGTVTRQTAPRAEDRSRQSVVEVVRQRGFINNRSYCEITNASRSTALRELADLVRLGVLERVGQGRSARYRLAEAGRVAA